MSIINNGSQSKDFYTQYINSRDWQLKRREVLKRDNHQCQTCLNTENLEIHHKTYERLGDENLDDLITLCTHCHEAITSSIRFRRHLKQGVKMDNGLDDKNTEYIEQPKEEVKLLNSTKNNDREVGENIKPKFKLIATNFNRR